MNSRDAQVPNSAPIRACSDCGRPLTPYNHSSRCISCNFRRKKIRELGLCPGWPDTPEYERALDTMMEGGGPHIDKDGKITTHVTAPAQTHTSSHSA